MTIKAWILGFLDKWIVGVEDPIVPFRLRRVFSPIQKPRNPTIRPLELSPPSALMGGQFPVTTGRASFKKPLFYGAQISRHLRKKELSLFDGPKNEFLHTFSTFAEISCCIDRLQV